MNSLEVLNPSVSYQCASHRNFSAADKLPNIKPLILVLGRDVDTRFLYRSFLEMWNYQVVEAESFEEIIPVCERLQPSLILMDGNSKLESNLEAIEQVRGNTSLRITPLIFISGYSQPNLRALVLKAGADDFLVKPLSFEDLYASVQIYTDALAPGKRQGGNI